MRSLDEPPVPEVSDEIAQAVVPSVPPIAFESHRPGRQVELVVGDEQAFGRNPEVIEHRPHRTPAFVHPRLRGGEPDLLPRDLALCQADPEPRFGTQGEAHHSGQTLEEPEPGVVTGSGVARAGIAEPDEKTHGHQHGRRDGGRSRPPMAHFFPGSLGCVAGGGVSSCTLTKRALTTVTS